MLFLPTSKGCLEYNGKLGEHIELSDKKKKKKIPDNQLYTKLLR